MPNTELKALALVTAPLGRPCYGTKC